MALFETGMRAALVTVAAACALLVSAAAASGSASRAHGPIMGVVPHANAHAHVPALAKALTALGPSDNLVYNGGPVMHTNTVYAIYWFPSGYTLSPTYENTINQYFTDVAAASGGNSNVYSVATQYYDTTGPIQYHSTFAGSVVATDPFPTPNGCDDSYPPKGIPADPVCLTDAQLQTEIQNVVTAHGWHGGLGNIFFLFTPSGVGSCADGTPAASGGECSTNIFCAYHSYFVDSNSEALIYANEPYEFNGCNDTTDGQGFPNDPHADTTISTISHEHNEAITDPLTDPSNEAWINPSGNENGDLCAYTYGSALGQIGGQNYNQVINGHDYSVQQEWSNNGSACLLSGALLAPTDISAPVVVGTAAVSKTLSTTAGSWSGSPTGYAYQWQRCSPSDTGCVAIPGATQATYTLAVADGGQTVRSTVSALNANGASSSVASATSTVVVPLPATTVAPALSGVAATGRTLSTTTGTWNAPMSFAYQWLRCAANGSGCTSIPGATNATYVVGEADGGHTLEARVSATNLAGTVAALSNRTAVVAAKPASPHGPRISGKARSGKTLRASSGAWSGRPTFAYQWLRCNAKGAHCAAIRGAKRLGYRLTRHDVGHRLRVRVTARNRAGSTVATSSATARVHA